MMKSFRELRDSLPSNTVVVTFCQFDPPTNKHDLLVQFVNKIAELYKADALIFIHNDGIIPLQRRLYYLNLLYPDVTFKPTESVTLAQAIVPLRNRYRNLVVISNLMDRFEVPVKFDILKLIDINPYISFDQLSEDAVDLALNGNFEQFKAKLPLRMRTIDARRMMNDIRLSCGKDELRMEVNVPVNNIREQYIKGQIFKLDDVVCVEGQDLTIIHRGTNYVVLSDKQGNTISKFLSDLTYG